jgi:hypothetical protein
VVGLGLGISVLTEKLKMPMEKEMASTWMFQTWGVFQPAGSG